MKWEVGTISHKLFKILTKENYPLLCIRNQAGVVHFCTGFTTQTLRLSPSFILKKKVSKSLSSDHLREILMQICEHICGKLPVRRLDIHCWHLLSCCTRQSQHLLSGYPRIPWAVQLWCCVWDSKADRLIEKVSLISWYCFLLDYSTHTLALAFICHIVMVMRVVWFFCKSFSRELFVSPPRGSWVWHDFKSIVCCITSLWALLEDPQCNNWCSLFECDLWRPYFAHSTQLIYLQWQLQTACPETGSICLERHEFNKKTFKFFKVTNCIVVLTNRDTLSALRSLISLSACWPCSTRKPLSTNTQKKDS